MNDHERQLMALRGVTDATGVVHEAQLVQVRHWAAIAFYHVVQQKKRWSVQVDPEQRLVSVHVAKVPRRPKDLPVFIASLDESIAWLFGPRWATRVVEGDQVIYQGRRRKSKDDERRDRIERDAKHRARHPRGKAD